MQGESPATSVRSLPLTRRLNLWSSWISEVRDQRRTVTTQRLETAARLASETRRARRTGEWEPSVEPARPWC
jgi:hypothetical protein